jgi:alcohol dehydrogenase (cytochrome c)
MIGVRVTGALVLLALIVLGGASAGTTADNPVNWLNFGNTVDENRYSPLTEITPGNVSQLGREFTYDLNRIVPGIKKGQQSYPIVVDGTIYVTSADDQVFAVNGVTGASLWHYAPDNVATFKNYGIVANRGLSYCDGKLFLLTLDMTVVALNPATGDQIARVPIGRAVPGAYSNYGYSETSAPICANHTVVIGAAGSDYGVRGFVMAYHTDLTPAWANPFWTIPPTGTGWRSKALLVGGATNWTPDTVDPRTNTLYFGTAGATPA